MFLTILGILLLVVIYFIGRFLKKNIVGVIIIGLIIGLIFEIQVAPMFLYDTKKLPYYFIVGVEAIPISIILAWSCTLSSCILLIEIIKKIRSEEITNGKYFFYGLISLAITGVPLEFIGYYTGLWSYTYTENLFLIGGVPWPAIIGWFFFGTVFLSTIKLYEGILKEKMLRIG